jgi:hypothetical protein
MEIDIKVETRRTFSFTLTQEEATTLSDAFGPGSEHYPVIHALCKRSCPACDIVKSIRDALRS